MTDTSWKKKLQRQKEYRKILQRNTDKTISALEVVVAAEKREKAGKAFLKKHPKTK